MLLEDVIDQADEIIEKAIDSAPVFSNAASIKIVDKVSGAIVIGYVVGFEATPHGTEIVTVRDLRTLQLSRYASNDMRYKYFIDSLHVSVASRIAREALDNAVTQQLIES